MRLIVIRHGQTTGDVEDRFGGWYDDLLSPLGEQQVENLASELADKGIEKIFTSTLKRAVQTAKGVADRSPCPILEMPNLRERNANGVLTGLTKAEGRARYPELVALVKDRLNTLPDAESYDDHKVRVITGFSDVMSKTQECSAIVWHGGCMRVLFRDILSHGDIGDIADCAWVELEQTGPNEPFLVKSSARIALTAPKQ